MPQDFPTFADELRPQLASIARRLLAPFQYLHLDPDDLLQEAFLVIWQRWPLQARNPQALAVKIAHDRMFSYVLSQRRHSMPAISLENTLTVRGRRNTYQADIPDVRKVKRLASRSQRRLILAALYKLPEHSRLAVMAAFAIEDWRGRVPSPDDVQKVLPQVLRNQKHTGLRQLRRLLSQPGRQA